MSKYDKQGSRTRDLGGGIKAPRYGVNDKIEKMTGGKTTGIVKKDGMPKTPPAKDFSSAKGVPYQHKFKSGD